MYAVVRIAGKQFEVRPQERIKVPLLAAEIGSSVEFDEVLLVRNSANAAADGAHQIGTPLVEGARVTAQVVEHARADKILVFHKKRRKGYKKKNGHRQPYSEIVVEDIQVP